MTATDQLRKALAYHVSAATALQLALTLIQPDRANGAGPATAVPPKARRPAKRRKRPAPRVVQRQKSAAILAGFSPIDPRPGPGAGHALGSLVRRGYLKKLKRGYVRTAKPFLINPGAPGATPRHGDA